MTNTPAHFGIKRKTRYPVYFEYMLWSGRKLKADLDALGRTHPHPEPYVDYIALPTGCPVLSYRHRRVRPGSDKLEEQYSYHGFYPGQCYLMEIAALHDPYLTVVWMNRATGEAKGLKMETSFGSSRTIPASVKRVRLGSPSAYIPRRSCSA